MKMGKAAHHSSTLFIETFLAVLFVVSVSRVPPPHFPLENNKCNLRYPPWVPAWSYPHTYGTKFCFNFRRNM